MKNIKKVALELGEEYKPSMREEIWWKIESWWEWPFDKLRDLKWFYQRGKRGYADCDVWALDEYLTGWLPGALKQMKEYTYGCPGTPGANTDKEWKQRLTEMIKGFEAADEILYGWIDVETAEKWKKKEEKLNKVFDLGMKQFHKHFFSLWD